MLKFIPLFMFAFTSLSAVNVCFERKENGKISIEHHLIDGFRGAAVHHAPQDPGQFPKRGGKKDQRENKRRGMGD